MTPLPELLAPAGNWDCARAAVANGADAIYFGMPHFNARLRADNFSEADLPDLMTFLHQHGVKGYVAFNTLIFTAELEAAARQLLALEQAGVDAVIVQDLGLASLVKKVAPNLRLHASTQMTITSPEGLSFAARLGIDQAVLAREISLRELERFHATETPELPLEVFVHGALCVAYSGQCLTSESLGQRSANRGECAQACRMPYEMIVDGKLINLGDRRYLLSPQDLAAIDEIPRLIQLGIRSFKIEGRLKTPEYVAAVTRSYRRAIDDALARISPTSTEQDRYALEMTFSRGLFSGWMHGVNHQKLVGARYGKKRGPLIGKVTATQRDHIQLDSFAVSLRPGDGVVIENPADTNHEQGGRIYDIRDHWLGFQHHKLNTADIPIGSQVFKTDDPILNRELRHSFEGDIPIRKQWLLDIHLSGSADQPLHLKATARSIRPARISHSFRREAQREPSSGKEGAAGNGEKSGLDLTLQAELTSTSLLAPAINRPLDNERLRDQLGRLGGTPFELDQLHNHLPHGLILPISELNRLRRALLEKLTQQLTPTAPTPPSAESLRTWLHPTPSSPAQTPTEPTLHLLCRDIAQAETALSHGIPRIYLDFEDIRRYADAVTALRSQSQPHQKIYLATPRIQKASEGGFFKLIERAQPDGVLIRNLGALSFFADQNLPLMGDFSLNVANHLTAAWLMQNTQLHGLTLSYDLNIQQILDLLAASSPAWFEITLHQHMPMFHMEHCAFAAFLSDGTDFTNCGRPCEKHRVALRDRIGMEHPLKADVGCRNTLFNAQAQTGADFFPLLQNAGLRHYRIELLEETAEQTRSILQVYQSLLDGQISGPDVWRQLKAKNQLGVTKGTLNPQLQN